MKYAEALTNLHKSGIDRNSTSKEIAAASVGTKLNKNGKPIISNVTQGQNYGSALKNYGLKTYTSTVNSVDAKSSLYNKEKNISNKQLSSNGSLSIALTGNYSGQLEHHLRQLELIYGKKYVSDNVFRGDKSKYDINNRISETSCNNVYVDKKYVYQSPDYGDNCCVTATAMLGSINSNGKDKSSGTSKIGKHNRIDHTGIDDYEVGKTGFHSYTNLNEKEVNKIITNEIDSGNVVMLHTRYSGGEHWVIVSSYNLNENGDIEYTYDGSKKYITGLGGIDPEEQHRSDFPQKTNNLGGKATVDSEGGQWLNSDGTVRTYNP